MKHPNAHSYSAQVLTLFLGFMISNAWANDTRQSDDAKNLRSFTLEPAVLTYTQGKQSVTINSRTKINHQDMLQLSTLPPALQNDIKSALDKDPNIDLELWLSITEHMIALNEVLADTIAEDKKKSEKKKQYILAHSFTSFMYMMVAVGEHAAANQQDKIFFPPVIDLINILIKHDLITDHSSFDQMLTTIDELEIKKQKQNLIITLRTPTRKTVEESFEEGIPSPRFVISSVIFKDGAQFIFSPLLDKQNKSELEEFKDDSQKNFGTGGLVLMDKHKENILYFLEQYPRNKSNPLIQPLYIQGKGFAGRGYLRGLKLPSPSAKMETIYLIPGRDGTPAFVRAKSLFVKPFVAL